MAPPGYPKICFVPFRTKLSNKANDPSLFINKFQVINKCYIFNIAWNVKNTSVKIVETISINRSLPRFVRSNFWNGDTKIKNKPTTALIKKRG